MDHSHFTFLPNVDNNFSPDVVKTSFVRCVLRLTIYDARPCFECASFRCQQCALVCVCVCVVAACYCVLHCRSATIWNARVCVCVCIVNPGRNFKSEFLEHLFTLHPIAARSAQPSKSEEFRPSLVLSTLQAVTSICFMADISATQSQTVNITEENLLILNVKQKFP